MYPFIARPTDTTQVESHKLQSGTIERVGVIKVMNLTLFGTQHSATFLLKKQVYTFFSHSTKKNRGHFPIPKLDLLNKVDEKYNNNLSDSIIFCVQHLMNSNFAMLKRLHDKGAEVHVIGKPYSTFHVVENQLSKQGITVYPCHLERMCSMDYESFYHKRLSNVWQIFLSHYTKKKQRKKLIIVDDGANAWQTMPHDIILKNTFSGVSLVEQTTRGYRVFENDKLPLFPVVNVARSGVKTHLENYLIAEDIKNKLQKLIKKDKKTVFGVVGNGVIGEAVTSMLSSQGYTIVVYDKNKNSFKNQNHSVRVSSVEEIIAYSDIIIGCTGTDITQNVDVFSCVKNNKTFISVSSERIEFASLISRLYGNAEGGLLTNPLEDIVFKRKDGYLITIERGGFPINFDNKAENNPERWIVTRFLMYLGIHQAYRAAKSINDDGVTLNQSSMIMLDPELQAYLAQALLSDSSLSGDIYPKSILKKCSSSLWVKEHSVGLPWENAKVQVFQQDESSTSKLDCS